MLSPSSTGNPTVRSKYRFQHQHNNYFVSKSFPLHSKSLFPHRNRISNDQHHQHRYNHRTCGGKRCQPALEEFLLRMESGTSPFRLDLGMQRDTECNAAVSFAPKIFQILIFDLIINFNVIFLITTLDSIRIYRIEDFGNGYF